MKGNVGSVLKIMMIFLFFSCSDSKTKEFEPSIIFNKIKTNLTEVRITLPKGGSKILKIIKEPIFESGKENKKEGAATFADNQNCKLINSFFSRVSGKTYHFYIYSKTIEKIKKIIVYNEEKNVSGFGESNIIYEGNVNDEINEVSPNYSELETLIFEGTCYSSNYELVNCKYELLIKGEALILNMYQNDNLIKTLNGIYFEKNIYIDTDEPFYTIENNQLCVSGEGFSECYAKKN
jgi:hypothetical protein